MMPPVPRVSTKAMPTTQAAAAITLSHRTSPRSVAAIQTAPAARAMSTRARTRRIAEQRGHRDRDHRRDGEEGTSGREAVADRHRRP
jgi:hypothetical protein